MLSRRAAFDENAAAGVPPGKINSSNGNVSKTPLATTKPNQQAPKSSQRRRAFGDLSNRKKPPDSSLTVPGPTKSGALSAKKAATPFQIVQQPTTTQPKQPEPARRRVAFDLSATTTIPPLLNDKSGTEQAPEFQKSTNIELAPVVHKDLDVDDEAEIELPAGRTWSQQLAMEQSDDDDSVISLEGVKNMRQELTDLVQERLANLRKWELEDIEASHQAWDRQVQAVHDADELLLTAPPIIDDARLEQLFADLNYDADSDSDTSLIVASLDLDLSF